MYTLIEHKKLDAAAASITFSNIPQVFTDLLILVSARDNRDSYDSLITLQPNGSTANGSSRHLYGSGTSVGSFTQTKAQSGSIPSSSLGTPNTFSNGLIYISNYNSSQAKSISSDFSAEYNGTAAGRNEIVATLWNDLNPITSLVIVSNSGTTFVSESSFTLYGINRTSAIGRSPQAVGGYINYANGYWYHTFTGSGSFIPFNNMEVEYLVVAGGGGGGEFGSGAGAGGYRSSVQGELSGGGAADESTLSLTASTNY